LTEPLDEPQLAAFVSPQDERPAPVDTLVPAGVVILLIAFSAQTNTPFWAPKSAVALTVGLAGVPSLIWLMYRRDAPAWALLGLLGVGGLSMALSHTVVMSLVGVYAFGTGFLFMVLVAGWWALGRRLTAVGRRRLEATLVWGAVGESAFAVCEHLLSFHYAAFQPYEGRYSALFDNPVYLAGYLSATYALLLRRVSLSPRPLWRHWPELAAMIAIGVGLQYSGERLGLIASGLAAVLAVFGWAFRGRRGLGLLCGVALGVGVAVGGLINVTGTSASSSVVSTTSNNLMFGRVYSWEAAAHAFAAKPELGWGPGRYEAATSHLRSAREARAQGPDEVFADAHNFLVEYATTTGVLGLAALITFLVLAARRSTGPMAWFAALIAVHMLAEPQSTGVTPLGLLALGAAMAPLANQVNPTRPGWAPPRWMVGATAIGAAGGLFAGTCLYYGDVTNHHAQLDASPSEMATAMDWMPPWPELAITGSQLYLFEGLGTPSRSPAHRAALKLARQAAADDPDAYGGWLFLAAVENRLGQRQAAFGDYGRALEANPWSVKAMVGQLATRPAGDVQLQGVLCAKIRQVGEITESQGLCPST